MAAKPNFRRLSLPVYNNNSIAADDAAILSRDEDIFRTPLCGEPNYKDLLLAPRKKKNGAVKRRFSAPAACNSEVRKRLNFEGILGESSIDSASIDSATTSTAGRDTSSGSMELRKRRPCRAPVFERPDCKALEIPGPSRVNQAPKRVKFCEYVSEIGKQYELTPPSINMVGSYLNSRVAIRTMSIAEDSSSEESGIAEESGISEESGIEHFDLETPPGVISNKEIEKTPLRKKIPKEHDEEGGKIDSSINVKGDEEAIREQMTMINLGCSTPIAGKRSFSARSLSFL